MIKSQDVADKAHGWFRTWFAKVWTGAWRWLVCGRHRISRFHKLPEETDRTLAVPGRRPPVGAAHGREILRSFGELALLFVARVELVLPL